jgi:hydrogenase maturation protease
VIEPELGGDAEADLSPHGLTPDEVLRRLPPGARPGTVRLVGCEPGSFGDGDGLEGLSAPVRAAVDEAVVVVERLVRAILVGEAARA